MDNVEDSLVLWRNTYVTCLSCSERVVYVRRGIELACCWRALKSTPKHRNVHTISGGRTDSEKMPQCFETNDTNVNKNETKLLKLKKKTDYYANPLLRPVVVTYTWTNFYTLDLVIGEEVCNAVSVTLKIRTKYPPETGGNVRTCPGVVQTLFWEWLVMRDNYLPNVQLEVM